MAAVPAKNPDILTDRWPALLQAMQDYKRQVAGDFSALAYRCVNEGIIRLDDRRRLAKAAHRAGIKSFDAQILIACAIRQWCLDQKKKNPHATPGCARLPRRFLPWKVWTVAALLTATLQAVALWMLLS